MQLDCPVERTSKKELSFYLYFYPNHMLTTEFECKESLGDSEHVEPTQNSLVDDSAPAELWSENQNLMLNNGPARLRPVLLARDFLL